MCHLLDLREMGRMGGIEGRQLLLDGQLCRFGKKSFQFLNHRIRRRIHGKSSLSIRGLSLLRGFAILTEIYRILLLTIPPAFAHTCRS